jgi:hypothetical protein
MKRQLRFPVDKQLIDSPYQAMKELLNKSEKQINWNESALIKELAEILAQKGGTR